MTERPLIDAITQKSLDYVASCDDPEKLRTIAANAHNQGNELVREAARRRVYEVLPSEMPGTLEYDVWKSIHALEDTLSGERGKTVRLSRTRQKIGRDGEVQTVTDLVLKSASDGYYMLIDRKLPDLTFEAVALRHPDSFEPFVLEAAKARLIESGWEPPKR